MIERAREVKGRDSVLVIIDSYEGNEWKITEARVAC
jgi:hypothetical protein